MPQTLWREEMCLNYPPLDKEHEKFLKTVSKAGPAALGDDLAAMENVFKGCYEYVRDHFPHEEDIMERVDFPGIEDHVRSHQMFIKNISEFRMRFEQASSLEMKRRVAIQAAEFLEVWFVGHLMSRDRLLKPYLTRLRNLPPRMSYPFE